MGYLNKPFTIAVMINVIMIMAAGCAGTGVSDDSQTAQPVQITVDAQGLSEGPAGGTPDNETEELSTYQEAYEPVFSAEEISDEVFERMRGVSYPEGCPVELSELRYLHLSYKDLEGNSHEGEMVCNAEIADKLVEIFRELYENDYPIEHMALVDDYNGDDESSMSANNTSCFNFRYISGTTKISKHGYGLAVDINPLYNPYVKEKEGTLHVEPASGDAYTDRTRDFDYKIDENDLAYKLFTEAGFTWGGSWKSVKDYQHFEY